MCLLELVSQGLGDSLSADEGVCRQNILSNFASCYITCLQSCIKIQWHLILASLKMALWTMPQRDIHSRGVLLCEVTATSTEVADTSVLVGQAVSSLRCRQKAQVAERTAIQVYQWLHA